MEGVQHRAWGGWQEVSVKLELNRNSRQELVSQAGTGAIAGDVPWEQKPGHLRNYGWVWRAGREGRNGEKQCWTDKQEPRPAAAGFTWGAIELKAV